MEASPGSSRSTNRKDRRLALVDGFWDFLAIVLLRRMWEVRCVCTKHPRLPLPGAPICCRQITFLKDLPRDLQNKEGSEDRTGFFPVEGHSDAQVSIRKSWFTKMKITLAKFLRCGREWVPLVPESPLPLIPAGLVRDKDQI